MIDCVSGKLTAVELWIEHGPKRDRVGLVTSCLLFEITDGAVLINNFNKVLIDLIKVRNTNLKKKLQIVNVLSNN